eukprot:IDg15087t1
MRSVAVAAKFASGTLNLSQWQARILGLADGSVASRARVQRGGLGDSGGDAST